MYMSDSLMRLGMLVLALLPIAALVWGGRLFVERQRRLARPRRWQKICSVNMRARYTSWPLTAPLAHSVTPSSSRFCAAYRLYEEMRSMRPAHLNWPITIAS